MPKSQSYLSRQSRQSQAKPMESIRLIGIVLLIMWLGFALNFVTFGKLNDWLAVKPRELFGLLGIFTHPFAHSGIKHIVSNSIPFFILSLLVASSSGLRILTSVWLWGGIGAGVGVWLFSASHVVGASGVVFALNGFLLGRCYFYPSLTSIATAIVALFLYSGALFSLLNFSVAGISWLCHISGFITGIALAFTLTKR